jgi:murein DD-endopeptidase MepM/ murein hydrolase activator NlpD
MVYKSGESVKYTNIVVADSDIWVVVHPSTDVTQYIAVLTNDGVTVSTPSLPEIPRTGKWTFASATDVHSSATTSSSVVATYDAGQSINYTNATIAGGYIWLSYTGGSGATRYVAVLKSDEATLKPETTISNGTGWPFAKAYTGYFEEGQQFGDTSFYRAGEPDHYFHDGFDFGSAIYGSGSTIKAVAAGKVIYAGYYDATLLDVIVVQASDGTEFMYQEFSSNTADIHVSVGQEVTLGQSIAKLTGTHLHLGITPEDWRISLIYAFNPAGPWINPITYISKNLA